MADSAVLDSSPQVNIELAYHMRDAVIAHCKGLLSVDCSRMAIHNVTVVVMISGLPFSGKLVTRASS
jgi:hypothetical protein